MSCGLRDVLAFESDPARPRPAVLVASSVFAPAAAGQAERLGAPDIRRVFVAHPVQDRTDDEVRALARAVAGEAIAAIAAA